MSESKESNRSSPKLIASVYSSGCPRPHLREHKRTHTKGERERRNALVDHTPRAVVKSRDTPQPNPSNSLSLPVQSIPFRRSFCSLTNEWVKGRTEGRKEAAGRAVACRVSDGYWGLGVLLAYFVNIFLLCLYVFGLWDAHDKSLGSFRVGTVVTTWPQSSVPKPKNRHHIHCSKVRPLVENAILPYWIMTTCGVEGRGSRRLNQFSRNFWLSVPHSR